MSNKPWGDNATEYVFDAAIDAMIDVMNERDRQQNKEGWTPEHDDTHEAGELVCAAIAYQFSLVNPNAARHWWPPAWDPAGFKPTNPRRDLVKAAALILAEIERLDRASKAG